MYTSETGIQNIRDLQLGDEVPVGSLNAATFAISHGKAGPVVTLQGKLKSGPEGMREIRLVGLPLAGEYKVPLTSRANADLNARSTKPVENTPVIVHIDVKTSESIAHIAAHPLERALDKNAFEDHHAGLGMSLGAFAHKVANLSAPPLKRDRSSSMEQAAALVLRPAKSIRQKSLDESVQPPKGSPAVAPTGLGNKPPWETGISVFSTRPFIPNDPQTSLNHHGQVTNLCPGSVINMLFQGPVVQPGQLSTSALTEIGAHFNQLTGIRMVELLADQKLHPEADYRLLRQQIIDGVQEGGVMYIEVGRSSAENENANHLNHFIALVHFAGNTHGTGADYWQTMDSRNGATASYSSAEEAITHIERENERRSGSPFLSVGFLPPGHALPPLEGGDGIYIPYRGFVYKEHLQALSQQPEPRLNGVSESTWLITTWPAWLAAEFPDRTEVADTTAAPSEPLVRTDTQAAPSLAALQLKLTQPETQLHVSTLPLYLETPKPWLSRLPDLMAELIVRYEGDADKMPKSVRSQMQHSVDGLSQADIDQHINAFIRDAVRQRPMPHKSPEEIARLSCMILVHHIANDPGISHAQASEGIAQVLQGHVHVKVDVGRIVNWTLREFVLGTLEKRSDLKSLHLVMHGMQAPGDLLLAAKAIGANNTGLEQFSIDLSRSAVLDDDGMEALAHTPRLTTLNMTNMSGMEAFFAKPTPQAQGLVPRSLHKLAMHPTLSTLILDCCDLSRRSEVTVANVTHPERPSPVPEFARHFKDNKVLTFLSMRNTYLNADSCDDLARAITTSNLRGLDLSSNGLRDNVADALSKTSLRYLNLSDNLLTDAGMAKFAGSEITALDLSFNTSTDSSRLFGEPRAKADWTSEFKIGASA